MNPPPGYEWLPAWTHVREGDVLHLPSGKFRPVSPLLCGIMIEKDYKIARPKSDILPAQRIGPKIYFSKIKK